MPCLFRGDLAKNSEPKIRSCFFIFADLEKAFYRVPGEVIRFTLRRKGIPEYLLHGAMCLYKACKTTVSVDGELSSSFSVKVGVRQWSALSPPLFIMVIYVLAEDVRDGSVH